jgi:hypothetical protein
MKILSFKFGDRSVVEFDNDTYETLRIKTSEEPRTELYRRASGIVQAASALFGNFIENSSTLFSISISYGVAPGSRIILRSRTKYLAEYSKTQFPKVKHRAVIDVEGQRSECPLNAYLDAVSAFIEEAELFVKGQRAQAEFDFEESGGRYVAEKILKFSKGAEA